jgi:signal transduction histidine kinase
MSFGWGTLIITGLAVTGGALLASRVQRRLDGIAATMVDVSHGRLGARIPLIGNGDDIDVVSRQVNAALDRLSALVDGMKQVSANIAHDLKTPLNRLQMILDVASRKTAAGQEVSDDLAEARAEGAQINETFDALLRIAQIEAGARKARFTDVDLSEVVETFAEIYADVA